ncbi:MAG: bifunctional folylpolyglutamate synthase/dihydrofolate synthase [Dehalococcoidia bacterium]|nr:bifunctional folylpolyglutamate synthase/dihydrofolate synthase [Dehalococcoidia bacterium]MDW8119414.1 folylpolyglutamate synthase/dihydrofolate synthase family protein [Chloroflexota bacterium]
MDYREALRYLLGLADWERVAVPRGQRPRYDLRRMDALVEYLGSPHKAVPAIHITGTKGKGSTSAMLASILTAAGYKVGLYTSPHLHTFCERIRFGLEPIAPEAFARLVEKVRPAAEALAQEGTWGRVTTFEFLTAMAFVGFRDAGCEVQVVEVGLGGTLDATNVIPPPLVSVITSISLDHTQILGDTVALIARDKAGIIKPGSHAVTAPQAEAAMEEIRQRAQAVGAPLIEVGATYRWVRGPWTLEGQHFILEGPQGRLEAWLPLLGAYQLENAACALAAIQIVRQRGLVIPDAAVVEGFRRVRWPARMEVLRRRPLVVADGAHNPYSVQRLVEAVQEYFGPRRVLVVFGASSDKDIAGMAQALVPLRPLVLAAQSRHPRSLEADALRRVLESQGLMVVHGGRVQDALSQALFQAGEDDLVLATGSLFVAAEVREALLGIAAEVYPEIPPVRVSAEVR